MGSLFDMLTSQLGGRQLGEIGRQLGTDEQSTGTAVAGALSSILGALQRNTAKPEGAQALDRALSKDHDGSLLDNLGGFLGKGDQSAGDAILGHVLGSRRQTVESGLSKSAGVDSNQMKKLMSMLAPVVMGALGKARKEGGMDAGGLASMLGQERRQLEQREPQATGLLGKLLDADGDGDVDASDLAKQGMGLLGKLFKR